MTKERKDRNDRDAAVSRAYRQISDETSPGELDARILAEAARAVRPGYVRPLRWMRPLAWAATIVLTVSIIVHMAELPTPVDIVPPTVEQDVAGDAPVDERLDEPEDTVAAPEPASAPAASQGVPAEAEAPAAAAERRERAGASGDAATASTVESFEKATRALPDADLLRRASDMARQQESGAEAAPADSDMALTATAVSQPVAACPEEERRSGAAWHACIERLRADGYDEAAAAELADLREAFPDFEIP